MVKNESRIIERLMGSVQSYIDGYVIVDTGSTDNTVELAKAFMEKTKKPGTVAQIPWVNFGVSRTASVAEAVKWVATQDGWDPKQTWGLLLDGDMILPDPVDKAALAATTSDAILLNQKNARIIYKNTRILRLDREWKCVGATHEYWDTGANKGSFETPVIQDLNDGGCKHDKFERDARLLEAELETNPNHDRTLFYLGQTYQSIGKKVEANEMLQRRIDVGGWVEEIYMSHVYRGDNLMDLKEEEKAVCEWLKAWEKMPQRTEAALKLIQHYRRKPSMQHTAMMFLERLVALQLGQTLRGAPSETTKRNNDSMLFVSHTDIEHTVWEELGILAYYTGDKKGAWIRLDEQTLRARHDWNARNHLLSFQKWYDVPLNTWGTQRLRLDTAKAPWATEADKHIWEAYNPSIRTRKDKGLYELVLRHANYSTVDAKHFPYRGREGFIVTRNVYCELDKDFAFTGQTPTELVVPKEQILHPTHHIQGIEDCRLLQGSTMTLALATGRQLTQSSTNKISCVVWNPKTFALMTQQMTLPSGVPDAECQKNWLPFLWKDEPHYVFRINPFTVCDFTGKRILEWKPSQECGWTLDGLRGSAAPIRTENGWLMVVHYSHYGDGGRRYYHRFLELDEDLVPRRMSVSFRLGTRNIEYVSGFTESLGEQSYILTYGVNDCEAYITHIDKGQVGSMLVYDMRTGSIDAKRANL